MSTSFEPEPELPSISSSKTQRAVIKPKKQTARRSVKRQLTLIIAVLAILSSTTLYGVYQVGKFYDNYTTKIQSPIILRSPIKVEKRTQSDPTKQAGDAKNDSDNKENGTASAGGTAKSKAANPSGGNGIIKTAQAASPPSGGCEEKREAVAKYFGSYTDQALFVSDKEHGCIMGGEPSPTADYCMFQIHNEPSTLNNLDLCAKRAWEKFTASGHVWRQWYAVCTPKTHISKYPEVIKC